jgi:transposase
MAMLMGLCLLVYSLGQREVRRQLSSGKTGIPNQLGKLTDRPTLRWIFPGFQGIHLLVHQGIKQVVNLTEERNCSITTGGGRSRSVDHKVTKQCGFQLTRSSY